jgi:hypothetical protein
MMNQFALRVNIDYVYISSRDHCHGDFRTISDANELYERQRDMKPPVVLEPQ